MKTVIKIILILGVMAALMTSPLKANALSGEEYIITSDSSEYLLSYCAGADTTPVMKSGNINEIIKYLNQRSGVRVSVAFVGIVVNESLIISGGNYTLTGSIVMTGTSELVVECGEVLIRDLRASFDTGGIRIKDGEVDLQNGEIYSQSGSAVVMEHASGATFTIRGGSVVSDSEAAIFLRHGTVNIMGGRVESRIGYAVNNNATLKLSGTPEIKGIEQGILTSAPIYLKVYEPFSGSVSVKCSRDFNEGEISALFYEASWESVKNIKLFGKSGTEYEVFFFNEHDLVKDKNFAGIYLPHIIKFYADGTLIGKSEVLTGEKVEPSLAPEKKGYSFFGWVCDDMESLFDFAEGAYKSFDLYAKYKLLPPSFSLSSLSFEYDKNEHGLGLNDINHPLLDIASVNCVWYRNGTRIEGGGTEVKLKNVSDSGMYKCQLYFTVNGDDAYVETPEVEVTINKALVNVPSVENKYYTGEPISADVFSTSLYSVVNCGGVQAGKYPIVFTLIDSENYCFKNGESTFYSEFEILKADNFFVSELDVSDVYFGNMPAPSASLRFGAATFLYSDSYEGVYSETAPSLVGRYFCKAYSPGTENYNEIYSTPFSFSILDETIVSLSVSKMPKRTSYSAFEMFDPDGLEIAVLYNSSRVSFVSGKDLSLSYVKGNCFLFSDNYVSVIYNGFSVSVPVNVSKAEYDVSEIKFVDTTLIYDGFQKSILYTGTLPLGLDGISLEASINGGGVDVGVYRVELVFSSQSMNYKIPSKMNATLTVLPFESLVIFEDTEFVYDGGLKCPVAYYIDIYGRKCDLSVVGERSLAGEYTATAISSDKNYKLLNISTIYKISKADYNFDNVVWNGGGYVYDGCEKSVSVTGLPEGVTVIGYGDNKAVNAGIYTAIAVLSYDEINYNRPPEIAYTWEIKKADYNLGGFSFVDSFPIYNGFEQYPTFIGTMPMGYDGIMLEYRFSKGALNVNDGSVLVDIIFFTESTNYKLPEPMQASVQIKPKGITVVWSSTEFTYNMLPHTPVAEAAEADVIVLAGMVNSGEHTAIAMSLDPNYTVINSRIKYLIKKASNLWVTPLTIKNVYEGDALLPEAVSIAGDVTYYYTNVDGEKLGFVPTEHGSYYVFAESLGDENYEPIISSGVRFEILEIVPVSINVELNKTDFFAFEKICRDDITVQVINNNGTLHPIEFSDLSIEYRYGDSLRFNDLYVKVSYGAFFKTVDINVSKADYDLSGAYWSTSEFIYDGNEKKMVLFGLPVGVSVLSYIGGVGKNAGEYPVSAILAFDSENYNPPIITDACLKIKKQVVTAPILPDMNYIGKDQCPVFLENDIYEIKTEKGTNAGFYPIEISLYNKDNYEFSNGSDSMRLYYEIKPVEIKIYIYDVDKYLLSEISRPEYEIISGSLPDGETLDLIFTDDGKSIVCTSRDPNHRVTFEGGKIIYHKRLSNTGLFIVFIIFLVLLSLMLLTVILVKRRNEIVDVIARMKCRQSTVQAQINTEENEIKVTKTENFIKIDMAVDVEQADSLITDDLARDLVRKDKTRIITSGKKRGIVNIDTLSQNFNSGDIVDVNKLKNMSLIPYDTAYIKVLARGMIDKPLRVYANDFSLSAVKMLALTGGEAIRVITVKEKTKSTKGLEKRS